MRQSPTPVAVHVREAEPRDLSHDSRREPKPWTNGHGAIEWTVVLLACALGAWLRLEPALLARFPLGDGGLFLQMTRDIQTHGWLPATTSYNHAHLPLAYPPFGFAIVLALHGPLHAPFLTLFRLFPPACAALSVVAFAWLARVVLGRGVAWVAATAAFACLPDAYVTEVMGGGVTRAPGQVFALLALAAFVTAIRRGAVPWFVLSGALTGLTALGHPDWALFACSGEAVLLVGCRPSRGMVIRALLLPVIAAGVSAPWWATVARLHGPGMLLAPLHDSANAAPWYTGLAPILTLHLTQEALVPLATALGLCGVVVALREHRFALPIWLVVALIVEPRADMLREVVVVALLAGAGFDLLTRLLARTAPLRRWGSPVALLAATATLFASGQIWNAQASGSLAASDVAAMSWARTHTPESARFFVVYPASAQFITAGEWFPAIATRINVAAPPVGYEWVRHNVQASLAPQQAAQRCSTRSVGCILRWARAHRVHFTYLFVASDPWRPGLSRDPATCCPSLVRSAERSQLVAPLYRRTGTAIYRVRAG